MKKHISKLISVLIASAMLLALMPGGYITASAQQDANNYKYAGPCGDNLTFEMDAYGNLTITGTGDMWEGEGYNSEFWRNQWMTDYLRSVTLESGVTGIASEAFYNYFYLTTVTIPDTVTRIGDYAFTYCSNLTDLNMGNGVKSIGEGAFMYCRCLPGVTLSSGLKSIGNDAFYACQSMTAIGIPDGVETIGERAFLFCVSADTVVIGKGVKTIGTDAFAGCDPSMFIVDAGNTSYYSAGNCLIEKATAKIVRGTSISIIPSGVRSIGYCAFESCYGMTSIVIPEGVTEIEDYAFYDNDQLVSINVAASVTGIGVGAFGFSENLELRVYWGSAAHRYVKENGMNYIFWGTLSGQCGDGVTWTLNNGALVISGSGKMRDYTYENGAPWERGVKTLAISDGVTSIGACSFINCINIAAVGIPDSVKSIGETAFANCYGVDTIVIGSGVTSIGPDAFWDCDPSVMIVNASNPAYYSAGNCLIEKSTAKIIRGTSTSIIPSGVEIIGDSAFSDCGMTSVVIPDGVKVIEDYAFYGCTALTEVTIRDSVTTIGAWAFVYCSGLENVYIGKGVTSIGYAAFAYCNKGDFTVIVAPDNPAYYSSGGIIEKASGTLIIQCMGVLPEDGSLKSIGPYAYAGMEQYYLVSLPKSLIAIDEYAFLGCSGLLSITIPESVKRIGEGAFAHCSSASNLKIGGDLETIGDGAFAYCSSLTEVVLPDKVTDIGAGAFEGCTGLTSVTIPASVKRIGDGAFDCEYLADDGSYYFAPIDVTLRVYEGSCAHRYAVDNGFKYELIGSAPGVNKGDADGDGEITVANALIALRIAAKLAPETPEDVAVCDTDGDGAITVADALAILRVAAKLVDSL